MAGKDFVDQHWFQNPPRENSFLFCLPHAYLLNYDSGQLDEFCRVGIFKIVVEFQGLHVEILLHGFDFYNSGNYAFTGIITNKIYTGIIDTFQALRSSLRHWYTKVTRFGFENGSEIFCPYFFNVMFHKLLIRLCNSLFGFGAVTGEKRKENVNI